MKLFCGQISKITKINVLYMLKAQKSFLANYLINNYSEKINYNTKKEIMKFV